MLLESLKDEEAYFVLERFKTKINIRWQSNQKKNLLHIAAEKGTPRVIDILLQLAGEEGVLDQLVEAEDNLSYCPLHYAALRLSYKAFEVFLRHNTKFTMKTNRNETVLTLMGTKVEKNMGNVEQFQSILKLLLDQAELSQTFLNIRPSGGSKNSVLHYVTAYGSLEDVEKVVELGALPENNSESQSPFHIAALHGKEKIMRFLLERFTKQVRGRISFDIDQKDNLGNTCLHTTLYKSPSSTNIVEMLIMAGTEVRELLGNWSNSLCSGAKLATVNDKNETPLDLIFKVVQNPGNFLLGIFEQNVDKLSEKKHYSRCQNFEFTFKYNIFNPWSGGRKGERKVGHTTITIYCCWEVVMIISIFLFLGEQLCLGQPPVQHRVQPQGRRSTDAPSSAGEFHPQEMAESQDPLQHPVLDYILLRVGFLPFHLHEIPLQ